MKKTRNFLTAVAAALLPLLSAGQDIHFSQLTETPLLLNPAQAGLSHDVLAEINYKDQWRSVTANPFRTFNVSGDFAFMKKQNGNHLGAGIDFFSDKAGDGVMGTTTGQLHFAGVLAVNDKNLISAGIYGGFGQRSLSYQNLYWDNQYIGGSLDLTAPSMEPTAIPNRTYADMGAGLAWFYGKGHSTMTSNDGATFTAGISVWHVNKPVYTFYGNNDMRLPMKVVAHGNADIGIKNYSLVLEPGYIVMVQGGHHEINVGMLVKYLMQEASHYTGRKKPASFVLGGYYRVGDAANIITAYEFNSFRIGFSYDINLSDLTAASQSRGGFEISLRYMMIDDGNNKNSKFFN
ncbi:MAG TPA: PorP/SprF family type IX secretion system membrane protein [Bacteroidia bacterium]|nr:PorP/SprF family type IX secretion system membrane protein [Bacteroidia bacterium]